MNIYSNGILHLDGSIGSWPGEDCFTAIMVREALVRHGARPLTVHLNSGGGFASDGLQIYHQLKSHPSRVTIIIDSIAASAASLLAMAGDEIVMRQGATMMLHDPANSTSGTAADHERSLKALDLLAAEMAGIYAARSGKPVEHVRKLMIAETWFSGSDAVAQGFADRLDAHEAQAVARFDYARAYRHAPEQVKRSAARSTLSQAVLMTNWKTGGCKGPKPRPRTANLRLAEVMDKVTAARMRVW